MAIGHVHGKTPRGKPKTSWLKDISLDPNLTATQLRRAVSSGTTLEPGRQKKKKSRWYIETQKFPHFYSGVQLFIYSMLW